MQYSSGISFSHVRGAGLLESGDASRTQGLNRISAVQSGMCEKPKQHAHEHSHECVDDLMIRSSRYLSIRCTRCMLIDFAIVRGGMHHSPWVYAGPAQL